MINKKPEMEALGLDKINACLENKKRVERNWLKFILVLTKFTHNINSKPNFLREIVLVYRHCFCSASFFCFIAGQNVLPYIYTSIAVFDHRPLELLG